MNKAARWSVLLFTLLLAAYFGYRLRTGAGFPQLFKGPEKQAVRSSGSSAAPTRPDLSALPPALDLLPDFEYPPGAIPGEVVLSFEDAADFEAYLAELARFGIRPKGVIRRLLAVRIDAGSMVVVDPRDYGGNGDYSFRVIQPPPPGDLSPEALASLRAFEATAASIVDGRIAGRGARVTVAVLDSGFAEHPDFADSNLTLLDLTGSGIDAVGAAHGTSVAAVVGGRAGVAPEADLMLIRVLDDAGEGDSFTVAEAIVAAVDAGAQVVNMSIGVYQDSRVLGQAVDYAHQQGVVLVAAVGNDAADQLMYPAAYPEVVAVTAVDARARQAVFPNRSEEIDIAAPGVGIVAATVDEGEPVHTLFSGTSAAAPLVSGTIAALLSENPLATGAQVTAELAELLNESGPEGSDPLYGAGVIDYDRISERDTSGVVDIALADIYIDPAAAAGTTVPVEVVVENRGTAWISKAVLEVRVGGGEVESYPIGSLNRGAVATRTVYGWVPPDTDPPQPLRVDAWLETDEGLADVRVENNARAVAFTPPDS